MRETNAASTRLRTSKFGITHNGERRPKGCETQRMWDFISYLFFFVFIAALIVVAGLLLRGYMTTGNPTAALTGAAGKFFGPKPEKRLDVVDQANVDGRRRLVLIRRDDVEHLIMTGGPVDVVIETNIGQKRMRTAEVVDGPTPIYTRQARSLDKALDKTLDKAIGEK
jgi:flagellar protein FliO/FliZ